MAAIEPGQSRDQPLHPERRRDTCSEHRTGSHRCNLVGQALDRIEGVGQTGMKCMALIGQFEFVGVPPEECESETRFEQSYLLADCRLRDTKLLRRKRKAAEARGGFEGTQPI
jgi:hypothetical protein